MAAVTRTRQTERDTAKARSRLSDSRVKRSEEFQRRVDAASRIEQVGTPQGNVDFTASTTTASSGGSSGLFAFKVIDELDGTVSVEAGSVNTEVATGLEPAGKPTELWLKATLNSSSVVTAAEIVTASVTDTETVTTRQVASITWDGDDPLIVQGLKGNQNLVSCGATHGWSSLYL